MIKRKQKKSKTDLYIFLGFIVLCIGAIIYQQYITSLNYKYLSIPTVQAKTIEQEVSIKEQVWNLLTIEAGLSFDEAIQGMAIVNCESRWDIYAIGVNKDGSKDLGLWQWNEKWHPDMTRAEMFDVYASTRKAIATYKKNGDWGIWVCSSKI